MNPEAVGRHADGVDDFNLRAPTTPKEIVCKAIDGGRFRAFGNPDGKRFAIQV